MSVCSVCGKNVPNFAAKIIRGKSGEWVCKECLNRANIGVFKFSNTYIPAVQIANIINPTSHTAEKVDTLLQISHNAFQTPQNIPPQKKKGGNN